MKTIIETIYELKAIANNTINIKKIDPSKGFVKEDFFRRDYYKPLVEQTTKALKKLTPTDELVNHLEDWITEISLKSDSNNIINGLWAEFKSEIIKIKDKIEESILPEPESIQPDKAITNTITTPGTQIVEKQELRKSIKELLEEELIQNKNDEIECAGTKQPDKLITEPQTAPISGMANITREEFKSIVKDVMKEILDSNSMNSSIKSDTDDLIKIDDVAKIFKVSLVTIHKWKKEGLIPFQKLNRRLYFKKSDVLNSLRKIGKK